MFSLNDGRIKLRAVCISNIFLVIGLRLLSIMLLSMGLVHGALAENQAMKPYFIYGYMSNGESLSLGEWISNKNQYHQQAYSNCVQAYPQDGEKFCELSQVSGIYTYSGASTRNGVQNPQGITWLKTKNGVTTTLNGNIAVAAKCPIGFSLKANANDDECVKQEPQTCEADADPINILTGHKFEHEVDYQSVDGLLRVERTFIDQING